MIQHRKSKPKDKQLIYDESADIVERSEAILRLAIDGYDEMESLLVKLLDHPHYLLRSEAVKVLVGGWGIENYLEKAIQMLHFDPEWDVRYDSAFALTQFIRLFKEGTNHKNRVLKELIICLINDEDPSVRKNCYEGIIKILNPEKANAELPMEFNSIKNVDWEMLQPYLEKYDLQKPS